MRKFKLLKDLPGIPAGTISEYCEGNCFCLNGLWYDHSFMKQYPDFFQEINPEWTDEDMIAFAKYWDETKFKGSGTLSRFSDALRDFKKNCEANREEGSVKDEDQKLHIKRPR